MPGWRGSRYLQSASICPLNETRKVLVAAEPRRLAALIPLICTDEGASSRAFGKSWDGERQALSPDWLCSVSPRTPPEMQTHLRASPPPRLVILFTCQISFVPVRPTNSSSSPPRVTRCCFFSIHRRTLKNNLFNPNKIARSNMCLIEYF